MENKYVDKVEIYRDNSGDWRWRAKAGNNRIVADSGEGYTTKGGAMEAAKDMFPDIESVMETPTTEPAPEPEPDDDGDEEDEDEATEEEPATKEALA